MSQYQQMSPQEIARQIIADGKVNADEVAELERHVGEDWVIGQDEAELLFQIHSVVRDSEDNCPSWQKFFSDSLTRYLVFDMSTPGEVSDQEANWLRTHLGTSTELNETERMLLREIKRHATSYCDSMNDFFKHVP